MFSSVIFHDHARERGLKPILGCEVYVAPGRPADEERHARRDGEPPGPAGGDQRGLPQPDQAGLGRLHRGVLLQAAHRQGAARAAREGADRAEQLPQGRGRRRAVAPAGAEGARGGRPRIATSSARTTSSSRCSGTASRSSASSTAACRRSRAISACRWSCTNDVHYLQQGRRTAARHPAVHRHRQGVQRYRSGCATTASSSS